MFSFVPSHAGVIQATSADLFAVTTTSESQTKQQDGSSMTIVNAVVAVSFVTEGTTSDVLTTTPKATSATTQTSVITTIVPQVLTTTPTTSQAVFALKQIATTTSDPVATTSSARGIEQVTKPPTATTEPLVTSAQIVLSTDTSTAVATTSSAPSNAPFVALSTCTTDPQCTSLALGEIATLQIQSSPLYAAVVAASQDYHPISAQRTCRCLLRTCLQVIIERTFHKTVTFSNCILLIDGKMCCRFQQSRCIVQDSAWTGSNAV